jgi:hypothetical protein
MLCTFCMRLSAARRCVYRCDAHYWCCNRAWALGVAQVPSATVKTLDFEDVKTDELFAGKKARSPLF